MVAMRLGPTPISVPKYAVMGMVHPAGKERAAVRHVAILTSARLIKDGDVVEVVHMAGPTDVFGEQPSVTSVKVNAAAFLSDLAEEECRNMDSWLDLRRTEKIRVEYVAHPPYEELTDEKDRLIARRFSCAGFVERCYADGAQIQLFGQDAKAIPEVCYCMLREIYPLRRERMAEYGIVGDGPWRVLMPGYVFHAMKDGRVAGGHRPSAEERQFP